jgi:hypothetical protein
MELGLERRSGLILTIRQFLTGIRLSINPPQSYEQTCKKWTLRLKKFYISERLREPLEIIRAYEKAETYRSIDTTKII